VTEPTPEWMLRDDARDAARYRWLRQRLEVRYLPHNASLPFHPFSIRLGGEFQEDDPAPEEGWQDRTIFDAECAKLDAVIDSRMPGDRDEKRWIVEQKSRGFDVIDTTVIPRHDGFYCYCVDRGRAELIARLLNRQDRRVA
jgi:hypothetical protein